MEHLSLQDNSSMNGSLLCARGTDGLWYLEVSFPTQPGRRVLGLVVHDTHLLVRYESFYFLDFSIFCNKNRATKCQIYITWLSSVILGQV